MTAKRTVAAVVVLAAIAATVIAAGRSRGSNSQGETDQVAALAPVETVAVSRRSLTESVEANGSVGHGAVSTLPIDTQGIVTRAPAQDDLLTEGDVAVWVNERPVTLAAGSAPMYRELRRVASGERDEAGVRVGLQSGTDVDQLQAFLLAEGFDDDGRLEPDGIFGVSTERAVKAWQTSVGLPATGRVDRAQIVFVDRPVRVESELIEGDAFTSLTVTSPEPTITVTVSAKKRAFFATGATVEVDGPDGTVPGTVTKTTRSVSPEGTTQYEVEITVEAGALGTAETIKVTATKTIADDVLTVPARALLALAEGGWAVQVVTPTGPEVTAVQLGDVVDGIAEIDNIDEGTEVVVPT